MYAALELILKKTAGKYTFGDEITLVRASRTSDQFFTSWHILKFSDCIMLAHGKLCYCAG
jgi:hypothetical protein